MSALDWIILFIFFAYTLWDGTRHNRRTNKVEDLLLAGRSMPWWAMGLSIMATQASAITFIGTTGQAYMYDMRFIQVYLGLPIAMVILCLTLVPYYYRLKAFTAYELLERRFGLRMRLATSFLFLFSRGATLGIAIAAPAYLLGLILHLPLQLTIVIIGISATLYTMLGGITGVIRTDVKQMALMMLGLVFCFGWMVYHIPVSFPDALSLAGTTGKLSTIDLSFDPSSKYNLWSGLLAGLFLMLSYFGTDQSQVQRYLTARSLGDAKASLMLSAMVKIPMQFFILLLGALMYVFFIFADHPLLFIPDAEQAGPASCSNEDQFREVHAARKQAATRMLHYGEDATLRQEFIALDQEAQRLRKAEIHRLEADMHSSRNDTNYVFPWFMLTELPSGMLGLMVAAILAAALSSIDSMLNSLATVSVMDWYKRLHRQEKSPAHYLRISRLTTLGWGLFATLSAIVFGETESIIELINKVGSYFYGAILGVFILVWVKRSTAGSAMLGFTGGLLAVFVAASLYQHCESGSIALFFPGQQSPEAFHPLIEYLWLNPIGTLVVLLLGVAAGKGGSKGEAS
ncbi:MAG: sodium-coupled permease [Bacteroidetes bacterium]|nr:MAG: sodium-coupled permease [Bacteroidota bacterium]